MHKNNLKVCEWMWLILNECDCIIIITKRSWSQKGEAMVYTVTFNPSLDYIVEVKSFELGMTNRTSYEHMLPGVKELMFQ